MSWTEPKTNWKPADPFLPDTDYLRIRGNILFLHNAAQKLYPRFSLAEMQLPAPDLLPCTDFFAAPDRNTDTLLDRTFRPAGIPRGRDYVPNGPVWDFRDLNRMESALGALHGVLNAQSHTQPALNFTLGGGIFGPYLS